MNNNAYSEIIEASSFYFENYSENQVNVSIKAKVKVYTPKAGQEGVPKDTWQYDTNLVDYYIKVPIIYDENLNMAVNGLPVMTAPQTTAHFKNKDFTGTTETDSETIKKITDSLNQFFKAYYEQNQTQIDYFLVDKSDIKGAGQKFSFNNIEKINVFKISENEFLAILNLSIDSFNSPLKQGFNVSIVKDGDKFLVKNIEPRTSNININK